MVSWIQPLITGIVLRSLNSWLFTKYEPRGELIMKFCTEERADSFSTFRATYTLSFAIFQIFKMYAIYKICMFYRSAKWKSFEPIAIVIRYRDRVRLATVLGTCGRHFGTIFTSFAWLFFLHLWCEIVKILFLRAIPVFRRDLHQEAFKYDYKVA